MTIRSIVLKNDDGYLLDIEYDRNFLFTKKIECAYIVDKKMLLTFKDEFYDEIKAHNLRFVEVDITYDEKDMF